MLDTLLTRSVPQLRNAADGRCLDTMGQPAPTNMGVSPCHGYGNNQLIRLNEAGQLSVGERCVEADSHTVKLAFCRLGTVDGQWQYSEVRTESSARVWQSYYTLLVKLQCEPSCSKCLVA